MNVKVKICGIRTLEAAGVATNAGADFLGFNFVPTSKRYINPSDAARIINVVKGKVRIVGVFQDEQLELVNNLTLNLGLDFVQLHGQETINYCQQIRARIIKVFALAPRSSVDKLAVTISRYSDVLYPGSLYLIDRKIQGSGEMADIKKVQQLTTQINLFFAGGLTPENVAKVIKEVKPFAVDVAGGVETNDIGDIGKIRAFIQNTKGVFI